MMMLGSAKTPTVDISSIKTRLGSSSTPISIIEKIDYNELTNLKFKGKGSFGKVFRATWKGSFVAIKLIDTPFNGANNKMETEALKNEKLQLSSLSHPNIIRLIGECIDPLGLVIEYADGGSLKNVLHGVKPRWEYSVGHGMSWALQVAQGVSYLHERRILHRDLKPDNLLVKKGGRKLIICDFGTVTQYKTSMTNNKGSVLWMAPEVFSGHNYNEKCDVFSWAIILWEILTRERPYSDMGNCSGASISWGVAVNGKRPKLIVNCPPPIEKLMVTCWNGKPELRLSMKQVVRVMSELCKLFPGADEPITLSTPSSHESDEEIGIDKVASSFILREEEEEDEGEVTDEDDEKTHLNKFPTFKTGAKNNKVLPTGLPPISPLSVQTDKNAWNFGGESGDLVKSAPKISPLPKSPKNQPKNPQVPNFFRGSSVPPPFKNSPNSSQAPLAQKVASWKEQLFGARKNLGKMSPSEFPPLKNLQNNPAPFPPPRNFKNLNDNSSGNIFSSHQDLSGKNKNSSPETPQLRGAEQSALLNKHKKAGHRRSSSYGSTFDFRNFDPSSLGGVEEFSMKKKLDFIPTLENAYKLLEPNLQPIEPLPYSQESLTLYNEHKMLAQEYFVKEKELEEAKSLKDELIKQLKELETDFTENVDMDLRRRKSENKNLRDFLKSLRQQLGHLGLEANSPVFSKLSPPPPDVPEPGYVVVSRSGSFIEENNKSPS